MSQAAVRVLASVSCVGRGLSRGEATPRALLLDPHHHPPPPPS